MESGPDYDPGPPIVQPVAASEEAGPSTSISSLGSSGQPNRNLSPHPASPSPLPVIDPPTPTMSTRSDSLSTLRKAGSRTSMSFMNARKRSSIFGGGPSTQVKQAALIDNLDRRKHNKSELGNSESLTKLNTDLGDSKLKGSMKFRTSQLEADFRLQYLLNAQSLIATLYAILGVVFCISAGIAPGENDTPTDLARSYWPDSDYPNDSRPWRLLSLVTGALLLFLAVLLRFRPATTIRTQKIRLSIYMLAAIFQITVLGLFTTTQDVILSTTSTFIIFVSLLQQALFRTAMSLITLLATLAITLSLMFGGHSSSSSAEIVLELSSLYVVAAAGAYLIERSLRGSFRSAWNIRLQHQFLEQLLRNMLPRHLAASLLQSTELEDHDEVPVQSYADRYDSATSAFIKIDGLPPPNNAAQFVSVLNGIVSVFDDLTKKFGAEKMKTISDVYMLAAGVPDRTADHTRIVFDLVLAMIEATEVFNLITQNHLTLQIGVHSGSMVGGVIGRRKRFAYDIWGDTVNVSSRMYSTGAAGCIQVTQDLRNSWAHLYDFERRGPVQVKGKGSIETWWLVGKKTPLITAAQARVSGAIAALPNGGTTPPRSPRSPRRAPHRSASGSSSTTSTLTRITPPTSTATLASVVSGGQLSPRSGQVRTPTSPLSPSSTARSGHKNPAEIFANTDVSMESDIESRSPTGGVPRDPPNFRAEKAGAASPAGPGGALLRNLSGLSMLSALSGKSVRSVISRISKATARSSPSPEPGSITTESLMGLDAEGTPSQGSIMAFLRTTSDLSKGRRRSGTLDPLGSDPTMGGGLGRTYGTQVEPPLNAATARGAATHGPGFPEGKRVVRPRRTSVLNPRSTAAINSVSSTRRASTITHAPMKRNSTNVSELRKSVVSKTAGSPGGPGGPGSPSSPSSPDVPKQLSRGGSVVSSNSMMSTVTLGSSTSAGDSLPKWVADLVVGVTLQKVERSGVFDGDDSRGISASKVLNYLSSIGQSQQSNYREVLTRLPAAISNATIATLATTSTNRSRESAPRPSTGQQEAVHALLSSLNVVAEQEEDYVLNPELVDPNAPPTPLTALPGLAEEPEDELAQEPNVIQIPPSASPIPPPSGASRFLEQQRSDSVRSVGSGVASIGGFANIGIMTGPATMDAQASITESRYRALKPKLLDTKPVTMSDIKSSLDLWSLDFKPNMKQVKVAWEEDLVKRTASPVWAIWIASVSFFIFSAALTGDSPWLIGAYCILWLASVAACALQTSPQHFFKSNVAMLISLFGVIVTSVLVGHNLPLSSTASSAFTVYTLRWLSIPFMSVSLGPGIRTVGHVSLLGNIAIGIAALAAGTHTLTRTFSYFWCEFLIISGLYVLESLMKVRYVRRWRAGRDKERAERLLDNMLPKQIVSLIRERRYMDDVVADPIRKCAVIQADIVGFTKWSSSIEPDEMVMILNKLYSKFDDLAQRCGVEKIKTLGDAYVAAAGIHEDNFNASLSAARFTLGLKKAVEEFNLENGTTFQFRYGIGAGWCVGGVIGKSKFCYDLWGQAVQAAQEMEEGSKPDAIRVNLRVYSDLVNPKKLKSKFDIEVINQEIWEDGLAPGEKDPRIFFLNGEIGKT